MKNVKTFESFISERREGVGKYNTVNTVKEKNDDNPCWDGYKIGEPKTKKSSRTGKRVNNCVPENESVVTEGQADVNKSYDKVIELIRKEARRLNDDDAYEFHERLKEFFNKTI